MTSASFLLAITITVVGQTANLTPLGSITDGLAQPSRLAAAPGGGIYVIDQPAGLVLAYDASGASVGSYAIPEVPVGIGVIPSTGEIVVARGDGTVGVYDTGFALLGTLDPAPLTMIAPNDIAVHPASEEIYITDSEAHRVLVFDATTRTLVRAWGMQGSGLGQFQSPQAIAIDAALDHVIVSDVDNFRVQVFNTAGVLQFKFGYRTLYVGSTQVAWFARSEGLAVDACSNIYVADALMGTVRIFSKVGKELSAQFIPAIGYGSGSGQLRIPNDVLIDGTGKLHVASTMNAAVETFQVTCAAPRGMAHGKSAATLSALSDAITAVPTGTVDNPYEIVVAMQNGAYDSALDINHDRKVNIKDLEIAVENFGAATVDDFLSLDGGPRSEYPYALQSPHMIADLPNLCGRCHSMNEAPGGMLTDWGQANLCVSCHTPGGRALAAPIDAASDANAHPWGVPASAPPAVPGPAPTSELALHLDGGDIRCATCHDPHESTTDAAYLRGSVLDGGLCGECHAEVAEWRHAGHSDEHADPWGHYDWALPSRAACRHCHSGNGFVDFSKGVPQADRNGAFRVLDCVVCHATHGVSQDNGLLRVYDSVTLPADGPDPTLTGKGGMATCMVCHNGRVAPEDSGITPHYALGGVMLEGMNGITFGHTLSSSPHSTLATCMDCHMAPTPAPGQPGSGKIGGHSFNVTLHDPADPDYGAENVQNACNTPACHGAAGRSPELLLTTVNRLAFGDYDGDGTIEGVQDETQGLMDLVLAEIEAKGAVKLPGYPYWDTSAVDPGELPLVQDAIWNWQFVNNSGDLGIHNTSYAVGLLQVTYKAITGSDVAGAFLRYGTEVASLPETVVTIQDVNGGAPVLPGGAFTVNFTIEDENGAAIAKADLNRLVLLVGGPANNYQLVIPSDSTSANFTEDPDGSFTYTRPAGFPTVYAPPVNDSPAFGAADGELAGQAILDGTYTVLVESRRAFGSVRKAGDATADFVVANDPGSPPGLAPRQLITQDACNACHLDLQLHGGSRKSVSGCMVCHAVGAEDLITDPESTPGLTVIFDDMIHKIHRSHSLPCVTATANSADPYRYEIIGHGGSVNDFSDIGFPMLPAGITDCAACHGGAAEGDSIYTRITRANCASCHDDINFTTGTVLDKAHPSVAGGLLTQAELTDPAYRMAPGGITHAFIDDTSCLACHGPGASYDVVEAHRHPTSPDAEGSQPAFEIISVGGMTGGGAAWFQPGDRPAVTFKLKNSVNDPQQIVSGDTSALDNLYVIVAGPTSLYQTIIPAQRGWNNGALGTPAANWVDNYAVDGTYTFILPQALPEYYPAQLNSIGQPPADQVFPFEGGWGQLYTAAGAPLDAGTYTVFLYGRRLTPAAGEREPVKTATFDVRVGADGPLVPYAGTVDTASCNACHGVLAFHGNQREGVESCQACHTAGAQSVNTYQSIDLRHMVHKLHNARNLTNLPYMLNAHGGLTDFSHLLISSMPGEAAECQVCHVTDAWKDPPQRDNMRTWMVACTSCHDSAETAAHVEATTLAGTFVESCTACHGEGTAWSVERMHKSP
jgi:predicted CXXCH cytochrome family protein